MVKFDHDFIGREALEKIAKGPHRKKVTLALDTEDVLKAIGSQLEHGDRAKFMEFPSAVYSHAPLRRGEGQTARRSASRPGSATAPTSGAC